VEETTENGSNLFPEAKPDFIPEEEEAPAAEEETETTEVEEMPEAPSEEATEESPEEEKDTGSPFISSGSETAPDLSTPTKTVTALMKFSTENNLEGLKQCVVEEDRKALESLVSLMGEIEEETKKLGSDFDSKIEALKKTVGEKFGEDAAAKITAPKLQSSANSASNIRVTFNEIVDEKVDGETAVVTVRRTMRGRSGRSQQVQLVKRDDKWLAKFPTPSGGNLEQLIAQLKPMITGMATAPLKQAIAVTDRIRAQVEEGKIDAGEFEKQWSQATQTMTMMGPGMMMPPM
jgi:hypothetical protein